MKKYITGKMLKRLVNKISRDQQHKIKNYKTDKAHNTNNSFKYIKIKRESSPQ